MAVTASVFAADAAAPDATTGPFAQPSTLPFQLPPFAQIKDADYLPAFLAGMAEQRREVEFIAGNPAPPSFENTILALERSGQLLERVSIVFFNLSGSNTDDEMQKVEQDTAPLLSAHQDAINLDARLFKRVDALYQQRATLGLDAESLTLLERYHEQFVRAGARLSDADKARVKAINEEVSTLTTQFRLNVLKAGKDGAVVVDNEKELDGLSSEQISAAADAAKERGLAGKWLLALQNTTQQPVLSSLKNRALRERIYRASVTRATSGDTDNLPIIAKIVKLRAERARLLGYKNHAAYVLEDETAATPEAVNAMLRQIAPAALSAARREAADIQKVIDAEAKAQGTKSFTLQPWDWDLYAQQVRKAKYDFDAEQVKPYFELDHVLQDGVFYAAHQLYGVSFKERKDLVAYRPDVRIYEVSDANGAPLALFLADYFARDNKQGGAWMSNFVEQSHMFNAKPVVINNVNLTKPAEGQPVLLSFDEVTTLFHEFGHALHGMFSDVQYQTLEGTNVARDFVEFPSQYNEMWAREPEIVAHYARHYRTGEAMPKALLERVLSAQRFNQGYATLEYLEAAMIDQSLHQISESQAPSADQIGAFEQAALKANGVLFDAVPPRYHSAYFLHIFSNEYSAGYYAYLWSEVLARDTGAWFHSHGGITRANGDYLRNKILARGRTQDPKTLFRNFYGSDPQIEPLLEYRGLVMPKK
ncbi:MAG: M3 family metallopeptidase [Steroidobacteraceae bacterium]